MVTFQSPFGGVTVEVAEGNEAAYHTAGWPLEEATQQVETPFSQMNKSQLQQVASDEGVDLAGAKTNTEIRDAITAHRESK